MRSRPSVIALAAALVLTVAAASARAETETPSPSPSAPPSAAGSPTPDTLDDQVVAFDGQVLDITFPEANIEGSVTEDGNVITLRADVFFAYNKASLNAKAAAALDRAAAKLTELNATRVRVSGYTDSKGSRGYNRGLSMRRANAVRSGLSQRLPAISYQVRAYGETRPVATNKTAGGRALNRRVTITVLG